MAKVRIDVELKYKEAAFEIEQLNKQIVKLEKDVDKTKKTSAETGEQMNRLSGGAIGRFKALRAGVRGVTTSLGTMRAALIATGVGAFIVGVAALGKLFAAALTKASEFSKSLSGLRAVAGATDAEMAALTSSAKDYGSTTAFTAVQVAQLQTELAKLGFTTGEILDATGATLNLAASLNVGLAEAASLAGSTLRSFGLDTSETRRVVDVMALSTASSALDFSSLTESLKIVAPTARAVGLSIEEVVGMLGALSNSGLKGSIAGTGLSKTFIQLNKKGLTLEDAFQKINASSNKLNTAVELVGIVGAKSLQTLANSSEDMVGLTSILEGAGDAFGGLGAAAQIAETRLDNLDGDTTKLSSAWEGFLLNIESGDGILTKIARGSVQLLTRTISFLTSASNDVADSFRVNFASMKRVASLAGERIKETFVNLGLNIKVFGLEAKKTISEIPFIGKAIDKEALEASLNEAEGALAISNKRLQTLADESSLEGVRRAEHYAELKTNRQISLLKTAAKKIKKAEEEIVVEQKVDEDAQAKEDKRLAAVQKLRDKIKKNQDDFDARTEEEKLALQRERAISDIERSVANETEKQELLLGVKRLYDAKDKELADKRVEEDVLLQEELRQKKVQASIDALDAVRMVAGEETKIGRALFIFKQGILIREQLLKAQATLQTIIATAAESGVTGAAGFMKAAAAAPPPLNVPLIATFAIQAAGIAMSIKQAVQAAKGAVGGSAGGSGGGSAPSAPSVPSFNVVGASPQSQLAEAIGNRENEPLKAYVVTNEITTAQSLERNIVDGASLG